MSRISCKNGHYNYLNDCPECLMSRSQAAYTMYRHGKKHDPVNHPAHYTQGGVECIDAIRAALTPEEFRGYCKGNMIKYIWRERHKGGNESLLKSEFYLKQLTKGIPT